MSVLKTIKGALSNVQHVGSSINKSLTKSKAKLPSKIDGVNIDAGADLLNKFQDQWSETHERSTANAQAAERVARVLKAQFERCEKQNEEMNNLLALVSSLPQLTQDISQLLDRIKDMERGFEDVEAGLVELTDVKEQEDFIANRGQHHRQLASYKTRKNQDLEQTKKELAGEHALKMDGYEARLQEHLQSKQAAFEEAFANEMQHYRQYGSTHMRPLLANLPHQVELADIAIEQDTSALDAFLASDENGPETLSEVITVTGGGDEEEEEEEEGCLNVGIVNTQLSDPEQELANIDPLNSDQVNSDPELSDPVNSDPECDLAPGEMRGKKESVETVKEEITSDENRNETKPKVEEEKFEKSQNEKSTKEEESKSSALRSGPD